jgi:hypothetical protein
VPIAANTTYVASYHAPAGGFSYTRPFFTAPLTASPLAAPVDAGVFRWGSSGFPDQSFQGSNYWVDVSFATTAVDAVPPVVEAHTPPAGATGVSPGGAVTASFSEPINPASLVFVLRDAANTPVAANVTYDAAARKATLQPLALLNLSTPYTASVSGATDAGGNVMAAFSWPFVTGGAAESIWGSGGSPAVTSQQDTAALELGMKFRSEIGGYVKGIRFYKGAGNTGTHTGSLWSATGELLGRVTFTGESGSGWQQALLPVPVQISPNTTYVVSYHAPNGGYSLSQGFFAGNAPANWPLQGLADGQDGPNGLFRYGPSAFPDQSYGASNYWVDLMFATSFVDSVAPTLTAKSPAASATKVAPGSNVTATFSEPVQSGSISFVLRDAQGNTLPSTLTYDAASRTATLNPNSDLSLGGSFTATVSGAKDPADNVMTQVSWSFSTPSCPCSIWDASATPAVAAQGDSGAIELGVKFRSEISGYVSGIRFYKGAGNTGTHVGSLWSATGTLLASAVFSNESGSGWQQVTFAGPVAIQAGTTYVASYFAPNGHYSLDVPYFTEDRIAWPLTALDTAEAGGNGLYRYTSTSAFPTNSYNGSNYWVDVVFTPTASDAIPPSLTSRTPAPNATGIAPDALVSATFNEAIDQQTLSFVLRNESNAQVAAAVTYDAATRKATLNPNADLLLGETYTATLQAEDVAGNEMAAAVWSFSTQACPCTLWQPSATPAVASQSDTQAIEVGVKFRSEVDGYIKGVRFYKGAANTGTHVAHLWTASGQLLATATFSGESATGWQQVDFQAPVAIDADTTYVASYHAPNGGYARNSDYFGNGLDVFPLSAPASGNGVYAYGPSGTFPVNSFASANYWVDVVFITEP